MTEVIKTLTDGKKPGGDGIFRLGNQHVPVSTHAVTGEFSILINVFSKTTYSPEQLLIILNTINSRVRCIFSALDIDLDLTPDTAQIVDANKSLTGTNINLRYNLENEIFRYDFLAIYNNVSDQINSVFPNYLSQSHNSSDYAVDTTYNIIVRQGSQITYDLINISAKLYLLRFIDGAIFEFRIIDETNENSVSDDIKHVMTIAYDKLVSFFTSNLNSKNVSSSKTRLYNIDNQNVITMNKNMALNSHATILHILKKFNTTGSHIIKSRGYKYKMFLKEADPY